MDSTDIKDRIFDFLKQENKSSAQFAQEIGVQPSAISHIISGRNKPSLDFVLKMLNRYTYLSADWLLFGRGNMSSGAEIGMSADEFVETNKGDDPELFTLAGERERREDGGGDLKSVKAMVQPDAAVDETKKASRIIIFHSDSSFTEYFPDDRSRR